MSLAEIGCLGAHLKWRNAGPTPGDSGSGPRWVVRTPLGGTVVVEFDVVESDQFVPGEGQARQPVPRVVGVGVVEHQDRPGAVGLDKDVPDQAFAAEFGGPATFGLKARPDVITGQVTGGLQT